MARASIEASTPGKKASRTSSKTAKRDSLGLLREQHRALREILAKPETPAKEIARAWWPHTMIEEQSLYPTFIEHGADQTAFDQGKVQRDLIDLLLSDLLNAGSEDPLAAAKRSILTANLTQLMKSEERSGGLFSLAKGSGLDSTDLERRIGEKNEELNRTSEGDQIEPPAPRALRNRGAGRGRQSLEENESMPRQMMQESERDERGRFVSDDDDGRYTSRGSRSSRGRDEDGRFTSNDRRSSRGGYSSSGRERDENRRFMSDEDDRSRSGGRMSERGREYSSRRSADRTFRSPQRWPDDIGSPDILLRSSDPRQWPQADCDLA
jgi:hypothetical protein